MHGDGEPSAESELSASQQNAEDLLTESLYAELKQLAMARLRSERQNHTLQATALVHEVWMRMGNGGWANRDHLIRTAAKCMRQVLTDYARSRRAQKRGGDQILVSLGDADLPQGPWSKLTPEEVLTLDQALTKLHSIDQKQCLIVELRFFGGLTEEEVAESVGISARHVRRDWESARAWLHGQMRKTGPAV